MTTNDLSDEQRIAIETAMSVLGIPGAERQIEPHIAEPQTAGPAPAESHDAAPPQPAAPNNKTPQPPPLPVAGSAQPAAAKEPNVALRRIARRDAIPLLERHVLVMWGLSTYRNDHSLGTTFIVDNSAYNSSRDSEFKKALAEALQLARAQGLNFIYVLE